MLQILGSILGCEIKSAFLAKNRLPTHQWVSVETNFIQYSWKGDYFHLGYFTKYIVLTLLILQMHLNLPLTNLKKPCQGGLESVIVLGKGTFANETSKVLLSHFPSKYYIAYRIQLTFYKVRFLSLKSQISNMFIV